MFFQQHLFISLLIICYLQFYIVDNLYAQRLDWDSFVEKIATDEELGSTDFENLLEDLNEFYEQPFNINTASKEDLLHLPFLSEEEIDGILNYINRYGPMKTLGELILVKQVTYQSRQYLPLFVFAGEMPVEKEKFKLKNLFIKCKNELITTLKVPLYQRDGYKPHANEELLKNPNKIYLGNALYHSLRYKYKYKNRLEWGVTMEKDPGEPFGSYGNWSYDAFAFYILLKNCGKLKSLVLGDYRLSFGEGLVVNTNFNLGKIALLNKMNAGNHVKPFSSTSETGFFRGTAANINFKNADLTFFYSYLPQDATLKSDNTISTLKTDGLHRTLLEISKKHNITTQSAGSDITWQNDFLSLGITGFYQHYSLPFSTGEQLYRRYYPQGKDFINVSAHYRYRLHKFLFSGETAFSHLHKAWASLNRIMYRFNNKYQIVALQRFYDYRYVSLMGNSFEEGGALRNESGFYIGTRCAPLNELNFFAYIDYFYFPWPKYGVNQTTDGFDALFQADWSCSKKCNFDVRYQIKKKWRYDEPYLYHKTRVQFQYKISEQWTLKTLGRNTVVIDHSGKKVFGFLAGMYMQWRDSKERLQCNVSAAHFDSRDYKAPMSFYEPGLLYNYSFLNYYGRGWRTAANCRWDLSKSWMMIFKYGFTVYTDRDEISSGLQRIDSNMQNDISFQLRYKF